LPVKSHRCHGPIPKIMSQGGPRRDVRPAGRY